MLEDEMNAIAARTALSVERIDERTSLSVGAIADRVDNAFDAIIGPLNLSVEVMRRDLSTDIGRISLSVNTLSTSTLQQISDIKHDLNLSVGDFRVEMNSFEDDVALSVQNLKTDYTLSVQNLNTEDEMIKASVVAANEYTTSVDRKTAISAFDLDQRTEENANRIEEVNRVLSSKIDANYETLSKNYVNDADFLKHYKLNEVNTMTEFLEVEDYAINVIADDVVDGYLTKDGVKYGKIEMVQKDPATGKISSFRLIVFEGDDIPQELGVGSFEIRPFEKIPTGFGGYFYTWNIEGDGSELKGKLRVCSNSNFQYCMATDTNLSLYINRPEFNGGVISAGYVVVESDKSEYVDLVNLTKDGRVRFDNITNIISSGDCGLSYHGGNEYGLSSNIVHYPYFAVEFGGDTVARIPSGSVCREVGTSELLSCELKKDGKTYKIEKNADTGVYEAPVEGYKYVEYDPVTADITVKDRLYVYKGINLAPADGDMIISAAVTNKIGEEVASFDDFSSFSITFGGMVKPILSEFNGLTVELTKTDGVWNTATIVAPGGGSSMNVSVDGFTFVFKHTIASGTEITRRLDFDFADFDYIDAAEITPVGTVDWSAERDDPTMDEVILTIDTSKIYSKGEVFD